MAKRKRGEASLEEKLAQWHKELVRGLKTAKGFERQRLSKRMREADAEKATRLEREVVVLKSLDLHQAAHAHLCSSLLKIKGVAESPSLPKEIRPVTKPSDLSEEEKTALHNVTSALCNRKQIKDVIEEATLGTCVALRVPMPDKRRGKATGKQENREKTDARAGQEDQPDDRDAGGAGEEKPVKREEAPDFEEPVLLKRRKIERLEQADDEDLQDEEDADNSSHVSALDGFPDSDAEERAFSRYDNFVTGSSSDGSGNGHDSDEEEDALDDKIDLRDSSSQAIRKPIADDDISISSVEDVDGKDLPEEGEDSDSDSDEALARPAKRSKTKPIAQVTSSTSAFLPSLMGGYISGSESASDIDEAVQFRKNRRGQKARQAIWDKKYGDKARHHGKAKNNQDRDRGWDLKRGAVGDDDDGAGGRNRSWKRGISSPFDRQNIHPDRQRQMGREEENGKGNGTQNRSNRRARRQEGRRNDDQATRDRGGAGHHHDRERPRPTKTVPKRDDTGALHPSWAAAKKAKEEKQNVAFQGKKIVFD